MKLKHSIVQVIDINVKFTLNVIVAFLAAFQITYNDPYREMRSVVICNV